MLKILSCPFSAFFSKESFCKTKIVNRKWLLICKLVCFVPYTKNNIYHYHHQCNANLHRGVWSQPVFILSKGYHTILKNMQAWLRQLATKSMYTLSFLIFQQCSLLIIWTSVQIWSAILEMWIFRTVYPLKFFHIFMGYIINAFLKKNQTFVY